VGKGAEVGHFGPNFALLVAVELANAPKRDSLRRPSMRANQIERLRRSKAFEVGQSRWRANQIETLIAEFDRICINLGHQIEAEERRVGICDPTHFAYPTYAKAARERRAKVQRSADALKIELDRLRSEAIEPPNQQSAA
jgi:vacuolar-type H+-ATPase subunit I/STV1